MENGQRFLITLAIIGGLALFMLYGAAQIRGSLPANLAIIEEHEQSVLSTGKTDEAVRLEQELYYLLTIRETILDVSEESRSPSLKQLLTYVEEDIELVHAQLDKIQPEIPPKIIGGKII